MPHDDFPETVLQDLDSFRTAITSKGIRTIILTWRAEWAPSTAVPGQNHGDVRFGSLHEVVLLAYDPRDGAIIRCNLPGAERAAVRTALEDLDVRIEERSRNVT